MFFIPGEDDEMMAELGLFLSGILIYFITGAYRSG
jgi:hypothetical protein